MKKVAGRLKLELSQYRDLEAFAQFGSDLDPETQRTLARGERLVKTLNQGEGSPMPVEEQVAAIYAATNGYVDRIAADRVEEFHRRPARARCAPPPRETLEAMREGDWGDDTRKALDKVDQGVRRGLRLRPRRGGPAARRRRRGRRHARAGDDVDGERATSATATTRRAVRRTARSGRGGSS